MQKNCLYLFFFVLMMFLTENIVLCAEPYDALTLAKLNQQYWDRLKKIEMSYSIRQRQLMVLPDVKTLQVLDETPRLYDETFKYRWISGGGCDTLHIFSDTSVEELPSGKVSYHNCLRRDGRYVTEEWVKDNGEYFIPASLAESLAHSCRLTMISPKYLESRLPHYDVFGTLFRAEKNAPLDKNLLQFLSLPGISTSKPLRSVDDNGDILWTFRIDLRKLFDEDPSEEHYLEITVNESKGFFLHRRFACEPGFLFDDLDAKTGKKTSIFFEHIVRKYQKVADGVFFPELLESGYGPPSSWKKKDKYADDGFYTRFYAISDVKINEQVKENPCYTIPEFYTVYRSDLMEKYSSVENAPAITSIWGKNNEPLVTFETSEEYNNYVSKALGHHTGVKPASFSKVRIVCITVGLLMIVGALLMKIWEKRNKGHI